jgi:sugar phosphate isomerase/epimerase
LSSLSQRPAAPTIHQVETRLVKLCLFTDSVPDLTLEQTLDLAAMNQIDSVEIATGGQSSTGHIQMEELLESGFARARFARTLSSRGIRLAALNCSAWPMHPVRGQKDIEFIKDSIRLAGLLEIDKLVTMSGCPGDSAHGRAVNWIWFPWPDEGLELLEQQWEQAAQVWQDLAELAREHGVRRIAFELHPLHLVYNVPSLIRLRDAVGDEIGANLDPSHLFWQQMDPVRVVRALGPAVHHVHLKDTQLFDEQLALNGVLDPRRWDDPSQRSWVFRAAGEGNGQAFWSDFLHALREIGYDEELSIENEDPFLPGDSGVTRAAEFIRPLLPDLGESKPERA